MSYLRTVENKKNVIDNAANPRCLCVIRFEFFKVY